MSGIQLSRRAQEVGVSATMAIDERLQGLKSEGRQVIALGAGQPDFAIPAVAATATTRAVELGHTRYTAIAGTLSLRRVLSRKFHSDNDIRVTPEQIVVSSGAKQALFSSLLALVDTGDEVLVPTPAWPSYIEMIRILGAQPVSLPCLAANRYKLTVETLLAALRVGSGDARILLLNNPCNPTGAVYSREELLRLAEVIRGENLFVVIDEIYEHLVYHKPFVSLAALPGMAERCITINGVSKAFSMTGYRIGFAAGPTAVIDAVKAMQSHTSGNACSISQCATEAVIESFLAGEECRTRVEEMRAAFQQRRDVLCQRLAEVPGVRFVPPDGAFYFFLDVSQHYGRMLGGQLVADSGEMAEFLLETAGVGVVPGIGFGDDNCIRISFAAPIEDLTLAVGNMKRALGGDPGRS